MNARSYGVDRCDGNKEGLAMAYLKWKRRLRIAAKLELSGFLLLLPGSSRGSRGANTAELLSMHTELHSTAKYPSAPAAIRFAMSEYLHTDCRLMHARQ